MHPTTFRYFIGTIPSTCLIVFQFRTKLTWWACSKAHRGQKKYFHGHHRTLDLASLTCPFSSCTCTICLVSPPSVSSYWSTAFVQTTSKCAMHWPVCLIHRGREAVKALGYRAYKVNAFQFIKCSCFCLCQSLTDFSWMDAGRMRVVMSDSERKAWQHLLITLLAVGISWILCCCFTTGICFVPKHVSIFKTNTTLSICRVF